MHTCSRTTLNFGCETKANLSWHAGTPRGSSRPHRGFAGHELRVRPVAEPRRSAAPCRALGSPLPPGHLPLHLREPKSCLMMAAPLSLLFLSSSSSSPPPGPKEVQLTTKSSPSAQPQRRGRLLWGHHPGIAKPGCRGAGGEGARLWGFVPQSVS